MDTLLFRSIRIPTLGATPPFAGTVVAPTLRARPNHVVGLGGGAGRVQGTVKVKGTPANSPVHRRVRLYRDRDGLLIREVWSDAVTGAYDFQDVETGVTYTVLAYDYTNNYRAVVADRVTPEAMPS